MEADEGKPDDADPEGGEQPGGKPVDEDAPGPWNTFEAVPNEWPDDLVEELARWKQGNVIADVQLTWVAPPGDDRVTAMVAASKVPGPVMSEDLRVDFAMVCSQTCDIGVGSAPGIYHPFVLVAPLISLSQVTDSKVRNLAKKRKIGWLFPTSKPNPYSDENDWFCDLRLMVPLSKSMLVGKDPILGFVDEQAHLVFSEAIAQKFRRPALSGTLSEDLPKLLRKFIQDRGSNNPAFRKVEQVRLLIASDRLFPARGQLIILMDSPLTDEEQNLWRQVEGANRRLFDGAGIFALPLTFTNVDEMTARAYRVTVPLHLDVLGFPSYP